MEKNGKEVRGGMGGGKGALCVVGAERQEFCGRGQACPRADGVGPGRVEAAWSMRECPGTRGKIVGNDQNVQRCESTEILWEAVAEPDGAKEATNWSGWSRQVGVCRKDEVE